MNKKYLFYFYSLFLLILLTIKLNAIDKGIELKILNVIFNEKKDTVFFNIEVFNYNKSEYILIIDENEFVKNGLFEVKFFHDLRNFYIINFRETYKIDRYYFGDYISLKNGVLDTIKLKFYIQHPIFKNYLDSNSFLNFKVVLNLNFQELTHLYPMFIKKEKVDKIDDKLFWNGTEIYTGKIKLNYP